MTAAVISKTRCYRHVGQALYYMLTGRKPDSRMKVFESVCYGYKRDKKSWIQDVKRGFWLVMTKTVYHTWSITQTQGESLNTDQ